MNAADEMNTTVKRLHEDGLLVQGLLGYWHIPIDRLRRTKETMAAVIKATQWMMEEVAMGRMAIVNDREGLPAWIQI